MSADIEPMVDCYACGPVVPRVYRQPMLNGSEHLRAECPECGRYCKFVPHTLPWTEMVETRPEPGGLL